MSTVSAMTTATSPNAAVSCCPVYGLPRPLQPLIFVCSSVGSCSQVHFSKGLVTTESMGTALPQQKCQAGKLHLCSECGLSTRSRSHFRYHQMTHTGERPFQCSVCSKRFTQRSNLTAHLRIHTGERPYQCNQCGKSFTSKSHLTRHLFIHTGERLYQCHLCPMNFATQGTLHTHVRYHKNDKRFKCRFCQKAFMYRRRRQVHEKLHLKRSTAS